jgi:hypothetical protein
MNNSEMIFKNFDDEFLRVQKSIKETNDRARALGTPTTTTTVTPTTTTTVTPTTTTTVTDAANKTETKTDDEDTTWDFLDDTVEIGDYEIKYKYIIGGVLLMVLLMKK